MALPTIKINSGTGSNTAASGAGPSTALFGTAAATATSTTVTLLVDNPDLSGVATDGSAALWVGSSSGRQWSKITGKDNTAGVKTVTVETAYANTESGKNWGIGGKRASWGGSAQLNSDAKGGWTIDVQTGETITADLTISATGTSALFPLIITSTAYTPGTWGSQPIIQTATSGVAGININCFNVIVKGINFKCTVGTPTSGNMGICSKAAHNATANVQSCIFDGWYHGIDNDNAINFGMPYFGIINCEIKNCTHFGMSFNYIGQVVSNCYIHNNTLGGVSVSGLSLNIYSFSNCIIANNTGPGIKGACLVLDLAQCTISGNGTGTAGNRGGINLSGNQVLTCRNTIFWNNGTGSTFESAGVNDGGGSNNVGQFSFLNCAFGGSNQLYKLTDNSNAVDIFDQFPNEGTQSLSASPFVSSTDWNLNGDSGAGANCRILGVVVPNGSATANPPDMGAIQTGNAGVASTGGPVGLIFSNAQQLIDG